LPAVAACGACGSPFEAGQEYCLECGSRLGPARGRLLALRERWERRLGRYPGDWVWASLAAAVVAAGAGAAAVVAAERGISGAAGTIVATTVLGTPPPPALPHAAPPATAPATRTAPTAPKRSTRARPAKPALVAWPRRDGYTVVLSSLPARGGIAEARRTADAALAAGVPRVGILVSDSFASLHPGYYVVFSGVYDTLEDAQAAAARLPSRFGTAYARQIAR